MKLIEGMVVKFQGHTYTLGENMSVKTAEKLQKRGRLGDNKPARNTNVIPVLKKYYDYQNPIVKQTLNKYI